LPEDIVPAISSSVAGPMGLAHLPRLWLKILLHATGRLPDGYRHGVGGFDEALCSRLGLDRDALVAFIESEKPDYLTCERWVCEHARDISPQTVTAFNAYVRTANIREELAVERRARFGIEDEAFANAVVLNDLDDWAGIHQQVAGQGAP
jgi:hypothetical protein